MQSTARSQVVKAMVLVRRPEDQALLVSGDSDESGAEYERPLGGHVEFGELAIDAVHREIWEELGQRLAAVRLLGVLENLFEFEGQRHHEIVFVFVGSFEDSAAYDIDEQGIRDDSAGRVRVRWRPVGATASRLVPDGLAALIEQLEPEGT